MTEKEKVVEFAGKPVTFNVGEYSFEMKSAGMRDLLFIAKLQNGNIIEQAEFINSRLVAIKNVEKETVIALDEFLDCTPDFFNIVAGEWAKTVLTTFGIGTGVEPKNESTPASSGSLEQDSSKKG